MKILFTILLITNTCLLAYSQDDNISFDMVNLNNDTLFLTADSSVINQTFHINYDTNNIKKLYINILQAHEKRVIYQSRQVVNSNTFDVSIISRKVIINGLNRLLISVDINPIDSYKLDNLLYFKHIFIEFK